MSKLIFTVGPPCSGKTTWSIDYIKTHPNTIRVSRDDIMVMLVNGFIYTEEILEVVNSMVFAGIQLGIDCGMDVIIDQTNCKREYIDELINMYSYQANIEFKDFDVTLETLKERNKSRAISTKTPPIKDSTIERIFKEYLVVINNRDLRPIKKTN